MKKRILKYICFCLGVALLWFTYISIKMPGLLHGYPEYYTWKDFFIGNWDPYGDIKPSSFVPSKWISENPNIWFEVLSDDEIVGQTIYQGKNIDISVNFNRGRSMMIYSNEIEGGPDFMGFCKFGEEELKVRIQDKDEDKIFQGKYDEIIFKMVFEE